MKNSTLLNIRDYHLGSIKKKYFSDVWFFFAMQYWSCTHEYYRYTISNYELPLFITKIVLTQCELFFRTRKLLVVKCLCLLVCDRVCRHKRYSAGAPWADGSVLILKLLARKVARNVVDFLNLYRYVSNIREWLEYSVNYHWIVGTIMIH